MRNRDELRALALISELGFGVAGPLVVFTAGGWWLDGQLGTGHWLVMIGLGLGLLGAGWTFYRLATAFPARTPGGKRPAAGADEESDQHGGE
ncbi:MAG TPA: AtpZ/AtpI family protein [Chloroflexia bacterium]|nr:AtpZ/AtpI family protein [Chloroflexia bacterium]